MGLDLVMVSGSEMNTLAAEDMEFKLAVSYLLKNHREAVAGVDIGDAEGILGEGIRVGRYSSLHYLRGLALAWEDSPAAVPQMSEEDFRVRIDRHYETGDETGFDQLINHSDATGFYFPFDFSPALQVTGTLTNPEGEKVEVSTSLGSSLHLLNELDRLAKVLDLDQDIGQLGEEQFDQQTAEHKWPIAAWVWGVLHWYARESVDRKLIIQFC